MLSEYSANAAYRRSLDMLEDDDLWVDEDLERDMEKDDKEWLTLIFVKRTSY